MYTMVICCVLSIVTLIRCSAVESVRSSVDVTNHNFVITEILPTLFTGFNFRICDKPGWKTLKSYHFRQNRKDRIFPSNHFHYKENTKANVSSLEE